MVAGYEAEAIELIENGGEGNYRKMTLRICEYVKDETSNANGAQNRK